MPRFPLLAVISAILCFVLSAAPLAGSEKDNGRVFYGNVYGTIQSAASNTPLAGVRVYISDSPVRTASGNHQDGVQSNIGWLVLPDSDRALRSSRSASDGTYLVNNIPIHGDVQSYTVVISQKNAAPVVVDRVPLLPGAIMALQVDVKMPESEAAHVVSGLETSEWITTNNYRHKLRDVSPPPPPPHDERVTGIHPEAAYTLTIYATREGLVGGTTANGHVIKERDHFAALPSTRVLCSKGGYEYQVRLEHNGYTETVPVWDIGPWNIHDNYWDPEQDRQIYEYLSDGGQSGGLGRGLPEAQAAYQDDFNDGYDEYGRKVANPAGIDLADGTFWDALQMNDNAWIEVSYLWIEDNGDSDSITCFIETLME